MSERRGWLLVVATAACTAVQVVILLAAGLPLLSAETFANAFPLVNVATVVGALVGAVILTRYPRHPIGRLFGWGQLGVAVGLLLRTLADTVNAGRLTAPPLVGRVADVLAVLLGSHFALLLLAVLLFLAPDGRVSRGWRRVLVATLAAAGLMVAGTVAYSAGAANTASVVVAATGQLGIYAGLTAAMVSLVLRMRRATGLVRQQLRWIAAAAAILAAAPVAAVATTIAGLGTPVWVIALLHIGYLAVPVATGLAVLRHRLYDIDRLIAASVVVAVLAVLALAAYLVVIGIAGTSLPRSGPWGWLSLAVFVVAVLALLPVRRVVRRLADRLVYGPQAMSYDALLRFTRQLAGSAAGPPFLAGVAEAAARLVKARSSRAVLILPDGTERSTGWPEPSTAAPGPAGSAVVVPVRHGGATVGRLELTLPDLAGGTGRRQALLESLAERVAEPFAHTRLEGLLRDQARDLDRLNAALARSRSRLIEARDISRRQVAGRIRAEVVDRLLPLGDDLAGLAAADPADPVAAAATADRALATVGTAIDRLRQITSTVYSRALTDRGLAGALRAESRDGLRVTVRGAPGWPPAVEAVLFASCTDLFRDQVGEVDIRLDAVAHRAEVDLTLPALAEPVRFADVRERIEVLGGEVAEDGRDVAIRLPLVHTDAGMAVVSEP